jgi:hypothetical protein
MHLVDQYPNSTFTIQELARLASYRRAVEAGFYTDWDGSAASTDARLLARLQRSANSRYPFTARERQRLKQLRDKVAAGTYAEDQPQAAAPPSATAEGGRSLAN